jgi:glyoxylase-like metal-dependent hydrolase (beta-lactamase superfamily II)
MRTACRLAAVLAVATLEAAQLAGQAPAIPAGTNRRLAPDAARSIALVRGNLYRAHNQGWTTVFYVTPAGIVLGDPISEPFSRWLRGELSQRFPGRPVRYVVYSHSHWDHAEGASVFADTAQLVAHENMLREMDGRIPQMPGDMLDRNQNGIWEANEIRPARCGTPDMDHLDRNADGMVTLAEYWADIRKPDIVYSQRMKLVLGGHNVDLIHPGQNHSVDATVMHFPGERAVFVTEFIVDAGTTGFRSWPAACGALPGFDGTPLAEWIRSIRAVEALDFDVLVPGHQQIQLTRADVVETRVFLEDLVAGVSTGLSRGTSLNELKRTLSFDKYRTWTGYEQRRELNIEAAYNNLRIYR